MPLSDYDAQMFFLTQREQVVLALIMVALLAGAGIRHLRMILLLPPQQAMLSAGESDHLVDHQNHQKDQ